MTLASSTLLTILILLCAAGQAALPPLTWLGGVRIELLPGVVAFGALTATTPTRAVFIATLAGLAQDALSAGPFGLSVIGYAVPAVVVAGLRKSLDRDLPWVQSGAGAWIAGVAGLVAAVSTGFSFEAFVKICLLALMSAVIAPLVVFATELLGYRLEAVEE